MAQKKKKNGNGLIYHKSQLTLDEKWQIETMNPKKQLTYRHQDKKAMNSQ